MTTSALADGSVGRFWWSWDGLGSDGLHAFSVAMSCLHPWGPVGCSLPGFSVRGIFQARILGPGLFPYSVTSYKLCPHLCNGNDSDAYSAKVLGIK